MKVGSPTKYQNWRDLKINSRTSTFTLTFYHFKLCFFCIPSATANDTKVKLASCFLLFYQKNKFFSALFNLLMIMH